MKTPPLQLFIKLSIFVISLSFLSACAFSDTDRAANDLCTCLRPISDVIDDGKSKKEKDLADYFDIIGKGISSAGKTISCFEEMEGKYDTAENSNDNWEEEVKEKARKKCPKVFRSIEELGSK